MDKFRLKCRIYKRGNENKKVSNKEIRLTGKNLVKFDLNTIIVPKYNKFVCWFD